MKKNKWLTISLIIAVIHSNFLIAATPAELLKKKFPVGGNATNTNYRSINYQKSAFAKYNPVSLFFDGSMLFYQKIMSEQLSSRCHFIPSCSGFSKAMIREYGIFKGVFLTADRLTRCSRYACQEHPAYRIDKTSGKYFDQISFYKWTDD